MRQITFKKIDVLATVKKHAVVAIIASILVLALGIVTCIIPGITSAVIVWISFGLFALAGMVGISHFIYPGKGNKRNTCVFVFSLLVVILFIVLLVCALNHPADGDTSGFAVFSAKVICFISIFYGIVAMINSILGLCSIGNLEEDKKGWVIAGLIISLVLAILMIIFPFIMWMVGVYIAAIYLIIMSIFYIVVASKAIHETNKAKKAGIKVEADVVEIKDDGKDVIDNK